jgi:hypothetical protein
MTALLGSWRIISRGRKVLNVGSARGGTTTPGTGEIQ